jgi:hypothetical protein
MEPVHKYKWAVLFCDLCILALATWAITYGVGLVSLVLSCIVVLYTLVVMFGVFKLWPKFVTANVGLFVLYGVLCVLVMILQFLGGDSLAGFIEIVFIIFAAGSVFLNLGLIKALKTTAGAPPVAFDAEAAYPPVSK